MDATMTSWLCMIVSALGVICTFHTIATAGNRYYAYRIRTFEKMGTAEADDEIVRITRICKGRLFGWFKKYEFFLKDTRGSYETRGTADKENVLCEDANNDVKV